MKLHKKVKIEAVTEEKTSHRSSLKLPHLDRSDKGDFLVATNGRTISVVPVECDESDVSGPVPIECLKEARKYGYVTLAEESVTVCGGPTYHRPILEMPFPNWRQVIPDNSGKKVARLKLDIGLLSKLADAMGSPGLVLEIPPEDEASESVLGGVIVRPSSCRGEHPAHADAYGVIMPMRIN